MSESSKRRNTNRTFRLPLPVVFLVLVLLLLVDPLVFFAGCFSRRRGCAMLAFAGRLGRWVAMLAFARRIGRRRGWAAMFAFAWKDRWRSDSA